MLGLFMNTAPLAEKNGDFGLCDLCGAKKKLCAFLPFYFRLALRRVPYILLLVAILTGAPGGRAGWKRH